MRVFFFRLSVPYLQCETFYHAGNNTVLLTSDCGKRVQIPISNLRPFIDRQGLNGRFRLIINDENKVSEFDKIS